MFRYLRKTLSFLSWQAQWYRLGFLFAMLSVIYLVSGCSSTSSKQSFEDFGLSGGLSLEKPSNWRAKFDDRTGTIALKAEKGILRKDSVHIVIEPSTNLPTSSLLSEHLESGIDITGMRFNLDSVTVIEEPTTIKNEEYEMATATILIPEDSTGNQVGDQNPDVFQTVELRVIRCHDNFAMVYIYKGNSEQLNAEAEDIVDSIELTCSTKP